MINYPILHSKNCIKLNVNVKYQKSINPKTLFNCLKLYALILQPIIIFSLVPTYLLIFAPEFFEFQNWWIN